MFPRLFMILVHCIGVCTFQEVGTFSNVYRLALADTALHQSDCLKILCGLSSGIHGKVCCWGPWMGSLVPGSAGGQAWCLCTWEPAWCFSLWRWAWNLGSLGWASCFRLYCWACDWGLHGQTWILGPQGQVRHWDSWGVLVSGPMEVSLILGWVGARFHESWPGDWDDGGQPFANVNVEAGAVRVYL